MANEILIALIGTCGTMFVGVLSFVGIVITNKKSNEKVEKKIEVSQAEFQKKVEIAQAVTDAKIDELTREVREHNNFARRMPVVENEIEHIEHDIHDLKKFHEKEG